MLNPLQIILRLQKATWKFLRQGKHNESYILKITVHKLEEDYDKQQGDQEKDQLDGIHTLEK